ncbi:cysteine--tRNA ligase [Candidatus Woesearchaeota archaeon]|nr:cysteine--tRNA ligase [Candidatus Woesearchaeota archaeon]
MIYFYNTLTRRKEEFKAINEKQVGLYTCGPTCYWYQHIGNLRTYVFEDILKKVLLYFGYNVKHVMNITDVGHLTSDSDTGEDKIEKAAAKEGKTAKEITNYYWKLFRDDFKKLNILEPNIWCKATEHIKEQIEVIERLEKKGFIYRTSDGIYFDTSKLKNYGELARLDKKGLIAGKRVDIGEKKNITDFALWKFSEKPGVRQQEWKSPYGIGFPGWHVECSAMSMKYLGETFDIHTGGLDHIPVHHTNEIAQSEAATGKKFVNYWLHGEFLTFKGEKVSKSKGGLFTISELIEKGFSPLSYRYLLLTTHYRKPLDFSLEALENAENSYKRLKNIVSSLKDDGKVNDSYLHEFEKDISNDLDMPNALAVLWKLVRDENAIGKVKTIKKMDLIFSLNLFEKEKVPSKIIELAEKREKFRKEKNWKDSDKIREEIEKLGFIVKDEKDGFKVERK